MRIDGFSPAYVPNRTTRPDVSEVQDFAQRQEETRARQQQPEDISASVRPDTPQAVVKLANEFDWQQYQQREPLVQQNLPHQASRALASYTQTASYASSTDNEASQMLGLDLYA